MFSLIDVHSAGHIDQPKEAASHLLNCFTIKFFSSDFCEEHYQLFCKSIDVSLNGVTFSQCCSLCLLYWLLNHVVDNTLFISHRYCSCGIVLKVFLVYLLSIGLMYSICIELCTVVSGAADCLCGFIHCILESAKQLHA